jgi:hypothetical protein
MINAVSVGRRRPGRAPGRRGEDGGLSARNGFAGFTGLAATGAAVGSTVADSLAGRLPSGCATFPPQPDSSADLARHDLPPGPRLGCGFDPVRPEPDNVGSIGPEAFGVTTDAVGGPTSAAASLKDGRADGASLRPALSLTRGRGPVLFAP